MRFLTEYNDTAFLSDRSILKFFPDGKVIAHFSKEWKVCGTNIFQYATKESAVKIWQAVDELIMSASEQTGN